MCERAAEDHPDILEFVPDHLKSQEMCNKAVEEEGRCQLCNVPDHFKTQEMCDAAVDEDPYTLKFVPYQIYDEVMCINPAPFFFPDRFKTQEKCDTAVCMEPYSLVPVPDCFKTQKMCDKAVREERFSLQCVPD